MISSEKDGRPPKDRPSLAFLKPSASFRKSKSPTSPQSPSKTFSTQTSEFGRVTAESEAGPSTLPSSPSRSRNRESAARDPSSPRFTSPQTPSAETPVKIRVHRHSSVDTGNDAGEGRPLTGQSARGAHKPPPTSWLSRSASKTFGRARSGSLGTGETAPDNKRNSLIRSLSSTSNALERETSASPSRHGPNETELWVPISPAEALTAETPKEDTSIKGKRSQVENFETTRSGQSRSAVSPPTSWRNLDDARLTRETSHTSSRRGSAVSTSTSDQHGSESDKPPSNPHKTPRRKSSRTVLGGLRTSRAANASQESLTKPKRTDTVSESLSNKLGMGRRASNAIEKAVPAWLVGIQNKSSDTRIGSPADLGGSSASQGASDFHEVARSTDTTTPSEAADRSQSGYSEVAHPPGEALGAETITADGSDGLPRRISGWILNMLAVENASRDGRMPAKSNEISPHRVHDRAVQAVDGNIRRETSNPAMPTPSSRPNTGLLATLSSSARSRAAAVASTTGFDRLLRALAEDDAEIWLLGTLHTPIASSSSSSQSRSQENSSVSMHPPVAGNGDLLANSEPDADTTSVQSGASSASSPASPSRSRRKSISSVSTKNSAAAHYSQPETDPYPTSLVSSRWLAEFQADFTSLVWCSYRSHFVPIARDGSISKEAAQAASDVASLDRTDTRDSHSTNGLASSAHSMTRSWMDKKVTHASSSAEVMVQQHAQTLGSAFGVIPNPKSHGVSNEAPSSSAAGMSLGEKMGIQSLWGRATSVVQSTGLIARSGLTTDAGWGCMLRTGQSLLASALIEIHLGRGWRRHHAPVAHEEAPEDPNERQRWQTERSRFATYARILSWFFDDPSEACPFGVHRMAREGKRLGKEVGEWFGPSTAAGAIKKLVEEFPEAGLGVSIAADGVIYGSDVKAAASVNRSRPIGGTAEPASTWERPVLILVGIRLGLEGVNPMYFDAIKALFKLPQTVGIAGGRPSSSYYFVGFQGDSLFYLDPHTVRPAVPFKYPAPILSDDVSKEASDEWWAHAYTEAELATFHCDRPKKMPIRNLDPSMLLGFLVRDAAAFEDLQRRVKALPKAIFSMQNEIPRWMRGEEEDGLSVGGETDDPSLESFSEDSVIGADEVEDEDESFVKAGDSPPSMASKPLSAPQSEGTVRGGRSREVPAIRIDRGSVSPASKPFPKQKDRSIREDDGAGPSSASSVRFPLRSPSSASSNGTARQHSSASMTTLKAADQPSMSRLHSDETMHPSKISRSPSSKSKPMSTANAKQSHPLPEDRDGGGNAFSSSWESVPKHEASASEVTIVGASGRASSS